MKNSKRLMAIAICILLAVSMVAPAFAADATYDLFIENNAENHTYDAYQIFQGDLSSDGTTLSNVDWGASVKDPAALIAALTSDTKEIVTNAGKTSLKDVFISLTTETNAALSPEKKAQLVAEILGTVSNDSTTLDRFAELVGEVIYDAEGNFQSHKYLSDDDDNVFTSGAQTTNDAGVLGYAISDLPAGYYLIKDRDETVTNEGDFYTKYIVRVVRDASIKPKGEGVTVEKSVNDTLDGTYTDYEDANINENIYYKWEGTLPNNLTSYDEYNYKFVDTMSKGLVFVRYEQIYIENTNGTKAHVFYDVTDASTENDTLPAGIVATDPVVGADGKTTFALEFEDLFELYPTIIPSQKVIVKYTCYLTRDAAINGSTDNTVELQYDNNPNGEGTGTTVTDAAYAFTFKIDIDKYDAANSATKLEGVEFILYYLDTVEAVTTKYYAKVVTEEMIEAGEIINDKVVEAKDLGVIYGWTTDPDEASILDTDANGAINVRGFDKGIYYLEETKTNDGYNLLDTPVQIEITPTYTVTGEGCSVTVNYEVDGMEQGESATVGVRNSKGSTLPSTGGIGTTIFYIVGAVLVVGAVVFLVTKKRMTASR